MALRKKRFSSNKINQSRTPRSNAQRRRLRFNQLRMQIARRKNWWRDSSGCTEE